MQKTNFVPEADVVLQFKAFSEIPAIKVEGVIYVAFPMPNFDDDKGDMDRSLAKASKKEVAEPKKVKKEEVEEEETTPTKAGKSSFTEDELMAMETKELEKICKSMGINPDDTDGKNTNKKLRLLILDAQKKGTTKVAEEPKSKGKVEKEEESDVDSSVRTVLSKLDKSKIDEDEAVEELVKLGGNKKQMTKLVDKFLGDADGDISDYVAECVEMLSDDEDAPTTKKGAASKGKKELTASDFEEGDSVEVYWATEDDWFSGKVIAIKGDSLKVKYDDDDSVSWSEEDDKFRKA